jgi:uncharacterized membrane protein AbrB (regulator of aidB expression)
MFTRVSHWRYRISANILVLLSFAAAVAGVVLAFRGGELLPALASIAGGISFFRFSLRLRRTPQSMLNLSDHRFGWRIGNALGRDSIEEKRAAKVGARRRTE